jgi:stage V sporulation protein AF
MDGVADKEYLKKLQSAIDGVKTDALVLSSQSLAECLIKKKWYNPFPKIKFTERPDCAAAHIIEGKIAVITDNSPAVMLLPSSIFDFLQETDDFYLPPLVGTYLRAIRCTVFFLTLFLSPLWYLLISYPQWIPPWLDFIKVQEQAVMPVVFQLFVLEFAIDGLKLAALNTPSMLSGSFSIIGGLILGDFAVRVGWFVPDTIFYMAFVAIANFSQPSYELGYAFKFLRLLILALTALFGVYGFISGFVIFLSLIATNKTVGDKSYLYPLIPFDAKALRSLIIRRRKR